MSKILFGAATAFAFATMIALPVRAEEKAKTTHESKRNADGTVDSKTETTTKIGDVTDTRTTEKATTHDLVGGGTTTTVDKTHKQSSPGHKTMKRHHNSTVKRDAKGVATQVTSKSE